MLGALVNCAAVLVGGTLGLLIKKGISQALSDGIMKGLALVVLYIAVTGLIKGENPLITILSVVAGGALGILLDLDSRFNRLGDKLSEKVAKGDSGFSSAFIATSLLYCVGAMTLMGALESGLTGDNSTLFAKSVLDGVASVVYAATLGVGVLGAAASVLVVEGGLTLLAQAAAPYLTDHAVAETICMGSVLLLGVSFNMLGLTKLKIVNYLPAILIAVLLAQFI